MKGQCELSSFPVLCGEHIGMGMGTRTSQLGECWKGNEGRRKWRRSGACWLQFWFYNFIGGGVEWRGVGLDGLGNTIG